MEKIKKLSAYNNYHDEKDLKYNNNNINKKNKNRNNRNKSIIRQHYFQRTLTCKKIETKNKNRDITKAETLRDKTDKRKIKEIIEKLGNQ